jgi:hypothetical protein
MTLGNEVDLLACNKFWIIFKFFSGFRDYLQMLLDFWMVCKPFAGFLDYLQMLLDLWTI